MQRLLVPLDGSPLAELALPSAVELAAKLDGDIILVRVVSTPSPFLSYASDLLERIEELQGQDATAYLDKLAERLRDEGARVQTRVVTGTVVHTINHLAKSEACDMIVMTSHGYGGLGFHIFGSIAQKLLHSASVPILVVRASGDAAVREEESEEAATDRALLRKLRD